MSGSRGDWSVNDTKRVRCWCVNETSSTSDESEAERSVIAHNMRSLSGVEARARDSLCNEEESDSCAVCMSMRKCMYIHRKMSQASAYGYV